MQRTNGHVTNTTKDRSTVDILMTYSEDEKQENEINAVNAVLPFEPAFIPVFPKIQRQYSLTDIEAKLYGFIWFYLSNGSRRFYFTNDQLAGVLCCSEASVKRSIKALQDQGLCEFSYRIKANGGTIRFVSKFPQNHAPTGQIDQSDGSERPAIDNKINKNLGITNVIPTGKDARDRAKSSSNKESYGNEEINLILSRFKHHVGVIPADARPRFVAHNIRQMITRFIREHRDAYLTLKGGELTFEYLLDKAWEQLLAKDYGRQIEKLETFRLKTRVYLDGASQALLKAYETRKHQKELEAVNLNIQRLYNEHSYDLACYEKYQSLDPADRIRIKREWDSYYEQCRKSRAALSFDKQLTAYREGRIGDMKSMSEKARQRLSATPTVTPPKFPVDPEAFEHHSLYISFRVLQKRKTDLEKRQTLEGQSFDL